MEKEKSSPIWTNFEDWELVAQSGNILIKAYDDEELHYFVAKATAGHWAQVYRNDHPMYHIIESFLNTDDEHSGQILDMLITLQYTMSAIAPDNQFVDEFMESARTLHERIDTYEKEHAEKTDDEILAEDEDAEKIAEAFEKELEEAE